MADLSEIIPEFVRNRRRVLHDLNEKQAQMFEAWTEEERQRDLDRVKQIMQEANDLPANANLKTEDAASSNPDLAELQKQLECNGVIVALQPSLGSRIKSAGSV